MYFKKKNLLFAIFLFVFFVPNFVFAQKITLEMWKFAQNFDDFTLLHNEKEYNSFAREIKDKIGFEIMPWTRYPIEARNTIATLLRDGKETGIRKNVALKSSVLYGVMHELYGVNINFYPSMVRRHPALKGSQHRWDLVTAIDAKMPRKYQPDFIRLASNIGFTGLGAYPNGKYTEMIHHDLRKNRAWWKESAPENLKQILIEHKLHGPLPPTKELIAYFGIVGNDALLANLDGYKKRTLEDYANDYNSSAKVYDVQADDGFALATYNYEDPSTAGLSDSLGNQEELTIWQSADGAVSLCDRNGNCVDEREQDFAGVKSDAFLNNADSYSYAGEKVCKARKVGGQPFAVSPETLHYNLWGVKATKSPWGGDTQCTSSLRKHGKYSCYSSPVVAMSRWMQMMRNNSSFLRVGNNTITKIAKAGYYLANDFAGSADKSAWVRDVSKYSGLGPNEIISRDDPSALVNLMKAVARREMSCNPFPYSADDVISAVENVFGKLSTMQMADLALSEQLVVDNEYYPSQETEYKPAKIGYYLSNISVNYPIFTKTSEQNAKEETELVVQRVQRVLDKLGVSVYDLENTSITYEYLSTFRKELSSFIRFRDDFNNSQLASAVAVNVSKNHEDDIIGLNPAFAACLTAFLFDSRTLGFEPIIIDGYRTRNEQDKLFKYAQTLHSLREVSLYEESPDKSTHVNGIAVDLDFYSKESKEWLHREAKKYGLDFSLNKKDGHLSANSPLCGNSMESPYKDNLDASYKANSISFESDADIAVNLYSTEKQDFFDKNTHLSSWFLRPSKRNDRTEEVDNLETDSLEKRGIIDMIISLFVFLKNLLLFN